MDNDSTTMHHLRQEVDSSISKKTDKNHTKKALSNSLFGLAASHKILKNYKVRNYIVRLVMYAVNQNQGQPDTLGKRLEQIVPHIYGK